jgi:oxygen-dependent protoporphyrinogen oxidase
MAIVSCAFRDVVLPAGSGLLVAGGERLATKAVTVTSQKWPVAARGLTLLRASVGRIGESAALQLDDEELAALVSRELRPLLGVTAAPVDVRVTRWGGGLPQYAVGHVDRVRLVRAAVAAVPGLAVCGAAYDGVGVPACIASARQAVDQVAHGTPDRGQ